MENIISWENHIKQVINSSAGWLKLLIHILLKTFFLIHVEESKNFFWCETSDMEVVFI